MPEPIADLTYRDYAGEHTRLSGRWLVIARMTWRTAFKKKSFWVFSAFAAWFYLILVAFLYVLEQVGMARAGTNFSEQLFGRIVWKDQFLVGFTYSQPLWLALGLLVGAGAIANDNGTNALLVYLSKPCRKVDYLLGKWLGVFLPLLVGMAVPTAFFYVYGLLNFREYGFVSQDPWLGLELVALLGGAAAFQASVVIGVSSLFNQGRMAGAAYAAAFFLLAFFANLMWVAWTVSVSGPPRRRNGELAQTAERLYYMSVDGLQIGWAKVALHTDGSAPLGADTRMPQMHAPPPALVVVPMVGVSAVCLTLAWRRVRAVEVVA